MFQTPISELLPETPIFDALLGTRNYDELVKFKVPELNWPGSKKVKPYEVVAPISPDGKTPLLEDCENFDEIYLDEDDEEIYIRPYVVPQPLGVALNKDVEGK